MDTSTISNGLSSWFAIWLRPRDTIRRIVDTNPEYQVTRLTLLAGFVNILGRASNGNLGDNIPILLLLFMILIGGPFAGLISLYISGAILSWTGSWFGGQATSEEVRAALAWSSVPRIISSILWIPLFAIYGTETFTSETPKTGAMLAANPLLAWFVSILGISLWGLGVIIGIWSLIIFLKCAGEVHRFSAWRALASIAVPILALIVPIVGCILLTP